MNTLEENWSSVSNGSLIISFARYKCDRHSDNLFLLDDKSKKIFLSTSNTPISEEDIETLMNSDVIIITESENVEFIDGHWRFKNVN